MAELDRYLERLRAELPLPAEERDEAVEEIAAHAADATAELVAKGMTAESAERRIISRFGPPQRLADQLAAARRGRWQLATAVGAALRAGAWAGFWGLVVAWLLLYVVVLAIMTIARVLADVAGWDLSALTTVSPRTAMLLGSMAAAGAAYAVGRALPVAVARASRRREGVIRPWILALGGLTSAGLGIFVIEATFDNVSALLTAALPLWFALGVMRPRLLPGWYPSQSKAVGLVLLLIAVLVFPVALLVGAVAHSPPNAWANAVDVTDPIPSYARIAPLEEVEFASIGTLTAGSARIYEYVLADPTSLDGWRDLRIEVWLGIGPVDVQGMTLVDPSVDGPIASVPVTVGESGHITATVELPVIPERDHYLAALVGQSPLGERRLQAWPHDELARWSGSVWEYLTVDRPR